MNVLTLRKITKLPAPYDTLPEFYVQVGCDAPVRCTRLHDAKQAAAYHPQQNPVRFARAVQ